MLFGRYNLEKEIDELKKQLNEARLETLKIRAEANETMAKERKRIDDLLKDIKQKFDNYMLELQGKVAFIGKPIFEVSIYRDKTKVKTVEYGDIRIEPLHLRFIKGEEF